MKLTAVFPWLFSEAGGVVSLQMSLTRRLRTVLVCSVLQFGALIGAPMLPQDVQELMRRMNQPKLARVLPGEVDESGDDPPDE